MRNTGTVPEPTTYTAVVGGRAVYSETVRPGQSHSDTWRRVMEAATTTDPFWTPKD